MNLKVSWCVSHPLGRWARTFPWDRDKPWSQCLRLSCHRWPPGELRHLPGHLWIRQNMWETREINVKPMWNQCAWIYQWYIWINDTKIMLNLLHPSHQGKRAAIYRLKPWQALDRKALPGLYLTTVLYGHVAKIQDVDAHSYGFSLDCRHSSSVKRSES